MAALANVIIGIAVGMAICTTVIYWHHTVELTEVQQALLDQGANSRIISRAAFKGKFKENLQPPEKAEKHKELSLAELEHKKEALKNKRNKKKKDKKLRADEVKKDDTHIHVHLHPRQDKKDTAPAIEEPVEDDRSPEAAEQEQEQAHEGIPEGPPAEPIKAPSEEEKRPPDQEQAQEGIPEEPPAEPIKEPSPEEKRPPEQIKAGDDVMVSQDGVHRFSGKVVQVRRDGLYIIRDSVHGDLHEEVTPEMVRLRRKDEEEDEAEVEQFHNKDPLHSGANNINGYKLGVLGRTDCPAGIDISYWKPSAMKDRKFRSQFGKVGPTPKFVTFEPDQGGWNNIRMAMETVMVFAHATGRILVMPPEQQMYLLNKDETKHSHGFADFFQLQDIADEGWMEIIEMEDFLREYAMKGMFSKKPDFKIGDIYTWDGRRAVNFYLREIGVKPKWDEMEVGLIFPEAVEELDKPIDVSLAHTEDFLGFLHGQNVDRRKPVAYTKEFQDAAVVHFPATEEYRYLTHFYTFIYFVDDWTDRFYKRFMRDMMHYREDIFCAASCIVRKIWEESNGTYSSAHIRRGDFQYKNVKLPAEELFDNSLDQFHENEVLYISSDERYKPFFDPFLKRYKIRFLDDYFEVCNLHQVNKNYFGMIDQIVAAYGRIFFGTWFSTFTGFITRMRGYLGMENRSNWYFFLPKKYAFQNHDKEWWPELPFYKREWPIAWTDIDDTDINPDPAVAES